MVPHVVKIGELRKILNSPSQTSSWEAATDINEQFQLLHAKIDVNQSRLDVLRDRVERTKLDFARTARELAEIKTRLAAVAGPMA